LNTKRQNQQKEKQTIKQKTLLPTSGAADRCDSGDPAALLVGSKVFCLVVCFSFCWFCLFAFKWD